MATYVFGFGLNRRMDSRSTIMLKADCLAPGMRVQVRENVPFGQIWEGQIDAQDLSRSGTLNAAFVEVKACFEVPLGTPFENPATCPPTYHNVVITHTDPVPDPDPEPNPPPPPPPMESVGGGYVSAMIQTTGDGDTFNAGNADGGNTHGGNAESSSDETEVTIALADTYGHCVIAFPAKVNLFPGPPPGTQFVS